MHQSEHVLHIFHGELGPFHKFHMHIAVIPFKWWIPQLTGSSCLMCAGQCEVACQVSHLPHVKFHIRHKPHIGFSGRSLWFSSCFLNVYFVELFTLVFVGVIELNRAIIITYFCGSFQLNYSLRHSFPLQVWIFCGGANCDVSQLDEGSLAQFNAIWEIQVD